MSSDSKIKHLNIAYFIVYLNNKTNANPDEKYLQDIYTELKLKLLLFWLYSRTKQAETILWG